VTFATDSSHVQFDKVKVDVAKLSAFFDGKYIDVCTYPILICSYRIFELTLC
jgi:hypothetical protein